MLEAWNPDGKYRRLTRDEEENLRPGDIIFFPEVVPGSEKPIDRVRWRKIAVTKIRIINDSIIFVTYRYRGCDYGIDMDEHEISTFSIPLYFKN